MLQWSILRGGIKEPRVFSAREAVETTDKLTCRPASASRGGAYTESGAYLNTSGTRHLPDAGLVDLRRCASSNDNSSQTSFNHS